MRNGIVVLVVVVILAGHGVLAQGAAVSGPLEPAAGDETVISKERELNLLKLREARLNLENAWNNYQREQDEFNKMKELREKEYVSGRLYLQALRNWEAAQTMYETAGIELRRTELSFLQDASRISIVTAAQRYNDEGKRILDFTLMNTSNVSEAIVTEKDFENQEEIKERLSIENILVMVLATVTGQGKVNIGKPFEIRIPVLPYGKKYDGSFILQQDKVEAVDLVIEYLGNVDEKTVYVEKQSGEDIPRVISLQFAQEGNAGESVLFGLELERLAEEAATFAVEVVNLPDFIRAGFEEEGTRLSSVRFPERQATRNIALRCYIPEELGQQFLDKPINFFAVVGNEKAVKELKALAAEMAPEPITGEQIEDLKVGYEALRLTPRGRPELQLAAPNLYFEIDPGEPVSVRIVVRNLGTVTLREVRIETDKPYDWTTVITPELLEKIDPKEEIPADIEVILPDSIGTGIYDMQVVANCLYEGEPVESPKKDVRINVKSRVNLLGTIVIVTLLVAAMLGVAVFTIRLARR